MRPSLAANSRIAVVIGPAEASALAAFADGKPRTDAARTLIQELVASPTRLRDGFAAQPPTELPKTGRTRLDVRLSRDLRRKFERWCAGKLSLGDALRAAIRAKKLGALEPPKPKKVRKSKRKADNAASPARPRVPAPAPAPTPAPVHRKVVSPKSAHDQQLDALVARVLRRRVESGGPMELSIAPWLEVQTCYADAEDTEDLVYDLDEGEQLIHLAEGWTQEVEVAVAILLADLANDEPLRVVVGATNSDDRVDYLDIADPGGTAERIATFLRRIGREGNYTLTLHGIQCGDWTRRGVVELAADLH